MAVQLRARMSTGYEFDVFISYRRLDGWPEWVEDSFLPVFKHWLNEELGHEARIFLDTRIETGQIWPNELANALAKSAVIVPLLCATYFTSDWCAAEYEIMEKREDSTGVSPLIVPATVHDGDAFRSSVKARQHCNLNEFVRLRMAKGSVLEEKLETAIKDWIPDVAKAVRNAPTNNAKWKSNTGRTFNRVFRQQLRARKPSWS